MQQILQHWLSGGAGGAQITVGKVLQVVPELHGQGTIQPKLVANLIVRRLAGVIPDDLQHAIDR